MEEPSSSRNLTWLKVHVRRTAGPNGSVPASTYQVFCPEQTSYVWFDQCKSCEHRIAVDRRDRDVFLVCDAEPPADLFEGQPNGGSTLDASRTHVASIMTADVVCVTPDLGIQRLTEVLLEHNISGAPVIDAKGAPVGVITKTDLLRMLQRNHDEGLDGEWAAIEGAGIEVALTAGFSAQFMSHTHVRDIMTPLVFAIPEDTPIARAAALMAYEGVHRVPVVSSDNVVVGLLSTIDVLRWIACESGYVVPRGRPSRT